MFPGKGKEKKMPNDFKHGILNSDFEQSMEMLRHYDTFHWDITKFCFSQICVIIGACWYIYEKINPEQQWVSIFDINISIIAILLILSSLFTFLCLISLLRNGTYFCKVSHYINELRNFSLESNDLNFPNKSKMWVNSKYPPLVDGFSTQFISMYILTICLLLTSIMATIILVPEEKAVVASIIVGLAVAIIVALPSCLILKDNGDNVIDS